MKTHLMTRNVFQLLRNRLSSFGQDGDGGAPEPPWREGEPVLSESDPHNQVFEKELRKEWIDATTIAFTMLDEMNAVARKNNMDFRVASIPWFPAGFYRRFKGEETWTPDFGKWNLLLPEERLGDYCRDRGIPLLATGRRLFEKRASPERIRSLYYWHGSGHLTPAGHAMMARLIFDAFYAAETDKTE